MRNRIGAYDITADTPVPPAAQPENLDEQSCHQ